MNQGFKLRYDQLRENDPTGPEPENGTGATEHYPSSGYTRNLCLVWPDGRRMFFNYAYLVAGEFETNNEKNLIKLSFSSHKVSLVGYTLETLFMALLDHLPRIIIVADPRYTFENDSAVALVLEVVIDNIDN